MQFTNRRKIVRTFTGQFEDYSKYKEPLSNDFHHRCAYCDTLDNIITTPFEVDHFIPRKIFKDVRDDLDCDYTNLIYCCKKCNTAKSSKFSGDISVANPTNEMFYDPTEQDYNDIFYRNEYGIIVSEDPKGKNMISELRLYRPLHALAWLVGQTNDTISALEHRIEATTDVEQKEKLNSALNKLYKYYHKLNNIFISNYNEKNDLLASINR